MNDNARGALALGARLISIKAWALAGLVAFIALIFLMAPVALVALTNTGSGTGSGIGALAATGVSDAVPAAYRDDVLKAALHNWGCSWSLNPPVSRSARVM